MALRSNATDRMFDRLRSRFHVMVLSSTGDQVAVKLPNRPPVFGSTLHHALATACTVAFAEGWFHQEERRRR